MKMTLIALCYLTLIMGCSKSDIGGTTPTPTPTPTPEATVVFTIDVDPGSGNIYAATRASQAISVNVSSKLPSAGIQVDVKTTADADNSAVSNSSVSSTNAATAATIDGLKPGMICTTTITVTSKSTSTNTATKSFKIAKK